MKLRLRLSPQTVQLLGAFLDSPTDWKYGYDISRNTGLKSGTLYPILIRLAERKLLEASWETSEIGRPPRHMYRLTREGVRYARAQLSSCPTRRVQQMAFEGVNS
jgi:PadR family transcriptional regulator PadR